MRNKMSPLRILSFVIAGAGMLIASELQRRETEELVEKVISEREARNENSARNSIDIPID